MSRKYFSIAGSLRNPTAAYEIVDNRIVSLSKSSFFLASLLPWLPWERGGSYEISSNSTIVDIKRGANGGAVVIKDGPKTMDFWICEEDIEDFVSEIRGLTRQ
ncbi:MAG: hypothetical protein OEV28_07065 [Nitrospirota bacterium]|nr:hypothetical protein [Nitrospirota bacterium]